MPSIFHHIFKRFTFLLLPKKLFKTEQPLRLGKNAPKIWISLLLMLAKPKPKNNQKLNKKTDLCLLKSGRKSCYSAIFSFRFST